MNQQTINESPDTLFNQVEQAKQQWEAAVDALPELICVVDDAGKVIRANRAVEDWTGIAVTQVVGIHLHSLLHPSCDQACYLENFYQEARQEANPHSLLTRQEYDAILDKHLLLRTRRTSQNKWSQRVDRIFILHDVTVQRQQEESLRQNARRFKVLNAISKSILIAQHPGQIAQFVLNQLPMLIPNSFACIVSYDVNLEKMSLLATSGSDATDVQKQSLNNFSQLAPDVQDYFKQHFVTSDAQMTPLLYDALARLSLGHMESVWNIPLNVEGRFIGTMLLADRRPAAFRLAQQPIVQEVAKLLTVALRQAWLRRRLESSNENLQNLLRTNQQQLQTVSHELRSPLGIIMGYTEMLHQGLLGPLTEEQQQAIGILEKKGDQLLTMVQSLFTLKKVDKANLMQQDINAAEFLQEIIDSWQILAANKEIKLKLDLDASLPNLYADRNLLNQVISNLLDNAIKFSQAEQEIKVSAHAIASELIISVSDEGRGIPPAMLESIFQRFYQLDRGSAEAKVGAGIGLALCEAIVNAHDGRIWAESEGEKMGSTFFISLPGGIANEVLTA